MTASTAKPPKPARPPRLLTADLLERVRQLLPGCLYLDTLAAMLGCHRSTMHRWLRQGKREERERLRGHRKGDLTLYEQFVLVVREGLAVTEVMDLATIGAASKEHWQAAAWRLERRWPEKYGKDRQEIRELRKQFGELLARVEQIAPLGPASTDPVQ